MQSLLVRPERQAVCCCQAGQLRVPTTDIYQESQRRNCRNDGGGARSISINTGQGRDLHGTHIAVAKPGSQGATVGSRLQPVIREAVTPGHDN
jgi:hypothetical protein